MAWLADILKDGTLVDNQVYRTTDGVLRNHRMNPLVLSERAKGARITQQNSTEAVWTFLGEIASQLGDLHSQGTSTLALFGEEEYEHNTEAAFIELQGTNAQNFTLTTSNVVGSVQLCDYSLRISSRFGDAFLQYIIADADGFLEVEHVGSVAHHGDIDWLLAFLWVVKMKRAYRLGLPKMYMTEQQQLSKVRGQIDIVHYFTHKATGTYQCTFREHSFNTPAVALFAAAFEHVQEFPFAQSIRQIYNTMCMAGEGKKYSNRELLGTEHFSNPYYHDYNVLIDLSKRVLQHSGSSVEGAENSSAFLFDVSMLFEYFLRKILLRAGFTLLGKREHRQHITAGALSSYRRKLEPDIVFTHADNMYVFDVKYKSFDSRYGVKREDLFQLHTYIGQYHNVAPVAGCGFMYPISEQRWNTLNLEPCNGVIQDEILQHGKSIPFYVVFVKVPATTSTFGQDMQSAVATFVDTMQKICTPH